MVRWRAGIALIACAACGRTELLEPLDAGGTGSGAQAGRSARGGASGAGRDAGLAGRDAGGRSASNGGSGGRSASSGGSGGTALGGRAGLGGRSALGGRTGFAGRSSFGGGAGTAGAGGFFAGAGGSGAGSGGAAGSVSLHCGDGVVDPGEECDDGNLDNQDACTGLCKQARCGDGLLWRGKETCEDGNTASGDGCSPSCHGEPRELAAGTMTTCALGAVGVLKCWGDNATGELGRGNTEALGDEPRELGDALGPIDLAGDLNVFAVAPGEEHTCAASLSGVRCWGYNADGELGLGDTRNRGDEPGEMGSALPFIDLGPNFFPTAIAASYSSSCAASTYGTLKCWGGNDVGQLGLGDTRNRGDDANEMGNMLPLVDLGSNVKVSAVTLADVHACALSTTGHVKCWGANNVGQLGLGDTRNRGDDANEMGDALPFVDLGTGELVVKVLASGDRTCALLGSGKLKCWGENFTGELGLGDTVSRGIAPGQMGDALPAVEVGTGHSVVDFALGASHTCVVLDDAAIKCWGSNGQGQLGTPGVIERGGSAADMGDNLPAIELDGAAERIAAGGVHTCVKLAGAGTIKCWGGNASGELGLGDTLNRGDDANEMGPNLPAVDVSF